jgi:hypothetical protein
VYMTIGMFTEKSVNQSNKKSDTNSWYMPQLHSLVFLF